MSEKIQLRRSATASAVPTTGQLDLGEIAINTYDGKMYIKKDNGAASIVEIGAGGGGTPGGATTQIQFNNAGAFGGSAGLTWNDTTKTITVGSLATGGNIKAPDAVAVSAGANVSITAGNGASTGSTTYYGGDILLTAGNANAAGTARAGRILLATGDLPSGVSTYIDFKAGSTSWLRLFNNGTLLVNGGLGTAGQVLSSNGSGSPISWSTSSPTYYKDPVRVTTTANITLSGTQTIDGVAVIAGDRVLVKNQSTASQNGIYVVAAGAWTRATDMDSSEKAIVGVMTFVQAGTIAGGNTFQLVNSNANPIVLGTSTQVWGAVNAISNAGATTTANSASGTTSLAIGAGAIASGTRAITISPSGSFTGTNATYDSILIGRSTNITSGANNTVAIGTSIDCNNASRTGAANIAISSDPGGVAIQGTENVILATGGNAMLSSPSTTGSSRNVLIGASVYCGSSGTSSTNCVQIGSYLYNNSPALSGNVLIGYRLTADSNNQFLLGVGGGFANNSDCYIGFMKCHTTTTSATSTEVGGIAGSVSTTPTERIVLSNDSTYMFDCDIVARNTVTDTESAVWNLKFGIRRGAAAANTALIGTPTKTIYGQDTGTTTWDVNVTADTTNGRPNISVTGEAAKTIRWVANIRMTKVGG